ncbi:MAG: hypothetical protein M1827_002935 [Pycnora praestabilis]|nr:MAG: hypothetical protein M1827_002935 [Pycnora praestabilis]
MAVIEGWMPPSREHWEMISFLWQFFPVITFLQYVVDFYPQGKTSIDSRFNIPGKIGWATMEAPGFINLLYIMFTLPQMNGLTSLPSENWVMAGLFTIHYLYRALLAPLVLNPSMSPIHVIVWVSALSFQVVNSTVIGCWLAGYGPTTKADWGGRYLWIQVGMMIFMVGFLGNIFHDDELREIRRAAARNQKKREEAKGETKGKNGEKKDIGKVYMMPEGGLFSIVLYPHYLLEWIEWCGFWMIGGLDCGPARSFVLNEISTMLPRALQGKRWYVQRFGKEKVGARKAVIPGLI